MDNCVVEQGNVFGISTGIWQIIIASLLTFIFAIIAIIIERRLDERSKRLQKIKDMFNDGQKNIFEVHNSLAEVLVVLASNAEILNAIEKTPVFSDSKESGVTLNLQQNLPLNVTLAQVGSLNFSPQELSLIWTRIKQLTPLLNQAMDEFRTFYTRIMDLTYSGSSKRVDDARFRDNTNRDVAKIAKNLNNRNATLRNDCLEFACFVGLYNKKFSDEYMKSSSKSYKKINKLIDEICEFKPDKKKLNKSVSKFQKTLGITGKGKGR